MFENGLDRLESITNVEKHPPEVGGLAYLVLGYYYTDETVSLVNTSGNGWEQYRPENNSKIMYRH